MIEQRRGKVIKHFVAGGSAGTGGAWRLLCLQSRNEPPQLRPWRPSGARFNIQANAVAPTVILTAMGRTGLGRAEQGDPMKARIPSRRFGEPVDGRGPGAFPGVARVRLHLRASHSHRRRALGRLTVCFPLRTLFRAKRSLNVASHTTPLRRAFSRLSSRLARTRIGAGFGSLTPFSQTCSRTATHLCPAAQSDVNVTAVSFIGLTRRGQHRGPDQRLALSRAGQRAHEALQEGHLKESAGKQRQGSWSRFTAWRVVPPKQSSNQLPPPQASEPVPETRAGQSS